MPFPGIITTLDDFNRADAPDLGANWGATFNTEVFPIFSNTAGATWSGDYQAELWTAAIFPADQRVWATLVFPAGQMSADELVFLLFRCPTTLGDSGYWIQLHRDGATIKATLYEIGAACLDTQDTGLADVLDGDFIGVDVVGDTFTLYHGTSAATAVSVAIFTDADINAPGYIGIGHNGSGA